MPQKLPALKPAEMIKALDKAGFKIVRQTGSHAIMWKPGLKRPIPVPIHQKELFRPRLSSKPASPQNNSGTSSKILASF